MHTTLSFPYLSWEAMCITSIMTPFVYYSLLKPTTNLLYNRVDNHLYSLVRTWLNLPDIFSLKLVKTILWKHSTLASSNPLTLWTHGLLIIVIRSVPNASTGLLRQIIQSHNSTCSSSRLYILLIHMFTVTLLSAPTRLFVLIHRDLRSSQIEFAQRCWACFT